MVSACNGGRALCMLSTCWGMLFHDVVISLLTEFSLINVTESQAGVKKKKDLYRLFTGKGSSQEK